ncbi:MAG: hypothetical protein AB1599_03860 [Planctomycetota bacterium]
MALATVCSRQCEYGENTEWRSYTGEIIGGDRFVFGTLLTGLTSADVLYLTNISADIPYTVFDLSPWIPAQAKAVILQLGIFNQAFTSGMRSVSALCRDRVPRWPIRGLCR